MEDREYIERAVWLRRENDCYVVAVEHNGKWVDVIRESPGPISHIVETGGISAAITKASSPRRNG